MAYGDWFEPRNEREEDLRRVYASQSKEAHKRGHMGCFPLEADEYRCTFAVVAEFRTRAVAARLCFDAVEHEYELEVCFSRWYGNRRYRFLTSCREQAQGWLDRMVQRHPLVPFRCAVGM